MKKKILITLVAIVVLTAAYFSGSNAVQGSGRTLNNLLDQALTQEHLSEFFDTKRGSPVLEWSGNTAYFKSGYLQSAKSISEDVFTLSLDVYAQEKDWQLRIDVGKSSGKKSYGQITFDAGANSILLYDGSGAVVHHGYSGKLQAEQWYKLSLTAKNNALYIYVNGQLEARMSCTDNYQGTFAIRNTGKPFFLKNLSCYATDGALLYSDSQVIGSLEGFSAVVLPGVKQDVSFIPTTDCKDLSVHITDAAGNLYEQMPMTNQSGTYTFSYVPRGTAGWHRIQVLNGQQLLGSVQVYVDAKTTVRTPDEAFNQFYDTLTGQVTDRELPVYTIGEYEFKMYMSWLRDHTHMMEAGIYLQDGFCDVLDFWLDTQHEDGFFYEMILRKGSPEWTSFTANSDKKFYKKVSDNLYVLRFEIEADIEYLVVDGVYMAWQSTGNKEWMQGTLDNLDRALQWIMTNPERWSSTYGLPIRGSSIDTYDFVYGDYANKPHNRRVYWWEDGMDWGTPMAIFHGDCTGFYQACNQLAEMYRVAGNADRATYWEQIGKNVQKNLIKVCWNNQYFAHMVQVYPKLEDLPSDWQEDLSGDWNRLSYSNTSALNRNILTQKQASSIIESFKALRDNPPYVETVDGHSEEKFFAEWVTIYPSYRQSQNIKFEVNSYVNGCIAPFCGGELANGCFKWGYAEYGYDIISRLQALCERDGKLKFFYHQDGSIYYYDDGSGSSGGPDAWGAAATHNAIVEGLAGFSGDSPLLDRVTLTPSWTVTPYQEVYASVSYGQTGKYLAYTASVDASGESIRYKIVGDSRDIALQLLLPPGHTPTSVQLNGKSVSFETIQKENDVYAVFSYEKNSNLEQDVVTVLFKEGVPSSQKQGVSFLLALEISLGMLLVAGTILYVTLMHTGKKKK